MYLKSSEQAMKLALMALPLFAALASVLLGQDVNWDLQNYHLYNPYAFLNDRLEKDLMPAGLQSYFNPFLDLGFFVSYSKMGPLFTGALLGFIQGLNLSLLVMIARNLLNREGLHDNHSVWGAIALAVLGGLSAGFISELGTTIHDSTLAVLSTASLYIVMRDSEGVATNPRNLRHCVSAGLLMGVACGLKPTFVVYALGLCIAILLAGRRFKSQFWRSFAFGVGTVGGVLIAGGYWYFHIWQLTGNPLFPQVNQLFGGELAMPYSMRDARFLPKSLLQAILYPIYFTIKPGLVSELKYQQLSWLLLFVLPALVAGKWLVEFLRGRDCLRGMAFHADTQLLFRYLAFSYLFWLVGFGIYRYLLPLEYFIPLVVFVVVRKCFSQVKSAVLYVCLGLLTLYNLHGTPSWGRAPWRDKLYSLDVPADLPEVSTILLLDMPLAWLVPLFPPRIPFIQIAQNFTVSDHYWQEAAMRADLSGELRVIYDPTTYSAERAKSWVEGLDYPLTLTTCSDLTAHLGGRKFSYAYCKVAMERP
jgi:hypothetical protein